MELDYQTYLNNNLLIVVVLVDSYVMDVQVDGQVKP